MANEEPLFNADMDLLRSRLRTSGFRLDSDSDAILILALKEVRVGFYGRLGETRVNELLSYGPEADNPSSQTQFEYQIAVTAEVVWMQCKLLKRLPTSFLDSSGSNREDWNAYPFRGKSSEEIQRSITACEQDLEDLLLTLEGNTDKAGNRVGGFLIQPNPSLIPFRPGDSVFWRSRRG